jgi:hypothetical protein
MRYNTSKTIRKKTAAVDEDFAVSAKRTRILRAVEAYSKLYYKSKLQPLVDARLEEEVHENETPKETIARRLKILNVIAREEFEKESEEVKREIAEYIAEAKASKEGSKAEETEVGADDKADNVKELPPSEYQRCASDLFSQKYVTHSTLGILTRYQLRLDAA